VYGVVACEPRPGGPLAVRAPRAKYKKNGVDKYKKAAISARSCQVASRLEHKTHNRQWQCGLVTSAPRATQQPPGFRRPLQLCAVLYSAVRPCYYFQFQNRAMRMRGGGVPHSPVLINAQAGT
jgi:hypothetical protein